MGKNRKVILYIAMSLDGYIASENDSLDWLFRVQGQGDNGYSKFYQTIDTILIGRRTYDWIMEHEKGELPYKDKKCYVFSKSNIKDQHIDVINEEIVSFTNKLKSDVGENIWIVGGGVLLHSFIKHKLVDEIRITIAPVLLGKGIPLFNHVDVEQELQLVDTARYNQFIELQYDVVK